MPKIEKKDKQFAWLASCALAIALLVLGFFQYLGTFAFDEVVFFAIVVATFPASVLSYFEFKWRRAIDERLPDLFRSIVQAQETGITLPQALEEAAKRDLGPLTAELKKMNAQISWGLSFEDALTAMGKRVNTILMQRTIPMIIEASHSGGHVEKVFDPMGKFIQTTLLLDKERRTQTRPYIVIIYVAFFVFLFTIVLLFRSFFVSIEGLPTLGDSAIPPEQIERIFFHMTIIQAFSGGLIAGKMSDGTVSAGFKHALILMIVGYVALRVFL